ncbi:MAG: hypothetical protein ACT4PZ_21770 [Panacagrimonas sp.]
MKQHAVVSKPLDPRQVFLFSGHVVDAPDRPTPRFPASLVPVAAEKIGQALDRLGAADGDLALSQAASGGDLLFLEACRQRGVRCHVMLPFEEAEFIRRSIDPSADNEFWRERFHSIKARLQDPIRYMPFELGEPPPHVDPFERCNLWLLDTALAWGANKLSLLCLWNGRGGDGPGGTGHMVAEVKRRSVRVTHLNPSDWQGRA